MKVIENSVKSGSGMLKWTGEAVEAHVGVEYRVREVVTALRVCSGTDSTREAGVIAVGDVEETGEQVLWSLRD
jgi:hypothetical protein